jgi:SnoaL-like protein
LALVLILTELIVSEKEFAMTQSMTRRAIVAAGLASPLVATAASARARGLPSPATTYDNEAIVRQAYHTAEGSVLDVAGFASGFANDGVINLGHAGVEPSAVGALTYRGDKLGDLVILIAKYLPDVHRELRRVNVLGDTVAVELSIQGTFLGPLETPAGIIQPTGAKIDAPGADFWYLSEGRIERFDCYILVNTIFDQMGIKTDFASAVARPAAK